MSDDEDHKCHCAHVVILQTKVSVVQWLAGIAIGGAMAVAVALLGQFISHRLSWEAPPSNASERLFLDRINKPDPPSKEHEQ